jgi:hypothetical protein
MSWFYSVPVAKIYPHNKYYFLTNERSNLEYFKLYSPDQITVTTDTIKRLPNTNPIQTIPREFIQKLNPQKDFLLKTRVSIGNHHHNFGEFSLGDVLTKNTISNSEYLTHAILSSFQPCLDFHDRLLIIPKGIFVPKFNDQKVIEKLTRAMHDAIDRVQKSRWIEFTLESNSEKNITVKVFLALSPDAQARFTGPEVGIFNKIE